ncbi:MAG: thioredoxin fold domain-containing protein [Acidilobus sp.]|nr:thioredoxin fold domain-containing protein [Acidilobus sp.]
MRGRSMARSSAAFIVVLIVVVAAVLYWGLRSYLTPTSTSTATSTGTTGVSTSGTTSTSSSPLAHTTSTFTTSAQLTLADIESMPGLSETPTLGPSNSSKVIVIVYDPECPYCALELNATFPFLYYVSANTSQARVIFLGLPIHEYSTQMLELLDLIYNKYGAKAFAEVLDVNYAFYVRNILLYEEGQTPQLIMPTNLTIIEIADDLGYNVTQQEASGYLGLVNSTMSFLLQHGITGTPTILAFNGSGPPVYVQVGLVQPTYLICNLTLKLSLSVPGVSC